MQSNNSIVDGINQSPLFAAAFQAAAPFFTGIRAGHRVFHFAVLPSGDIVVPMVFPQGVRLVPTCRRWLELNLLHDTEVQRRRASPDASVRASVLLNCHNHRGRLCWHQRENRCNRNPCDFIHVDYSMMASEGEAMTAFNRLARTLPPPPMMMQMTRQPVFIPAAVTHIIPPPMLQVMQMTQQPVFIPAAVTRIIPPAAVPPVQFVDVASVRSGFAAAAAAPAAPAAPAMPVAPVAPARHIIRVRNNNYAFDVAPNNKLVMHFKLRAEPAVHTRLVCREWLTNALKERDDPTRVARTECAATHGPQDQHPGNWMLPCLFYLAHNCTRPTGTCGFSHILADKVDAPVAVSAVASAASQVLPSADDFASVLGGSSSASQAASWVSSAAVMAAPVTDVAAVAVIAPVARVSGENKARTHRYTAWCNGSEKCPGPEKCMFIHTETAHLARMDPSLPERIAFRADLANGKVDFDAIYVMVYEALLKDIAMVEEIHQNKKAHRSNFFVFLNEELVGQIKCLETVDFGRLVSLWRSMIQVVRSEKTVEKLELDVKTPGSSTNAEGYDDMIDFALSAGRDSRVEQHVLALAALTRTCFSHKYGDRMCFVARFAAEKKTELAAFDKDVLKKFSGFCVPKKRDVCLATAWCCHHGGHVSTNGKEGKEQNGSVLTLEGLNGNEINDANVPVTIKAKALRAELYEQFTARQLEVLRLHQDVKEEESRTEFKAVARDATSARDKLATARAKALEEARELEMELAKVQDRLTRHADATNKLPILELKCELTELQHEQFITAIRIDNLTYRIAGEKAVLNKTETSARRSLADVKQTEGRLVKSADDEGEEAVKRRSQLQTQLEEHTRAHQQFVYQLEADKEVIATTEKDIKEVRCKMDAIIARLSHLKSREMELDPVIAEARQKMEDLGAFIKRLQLPHEIKRAKEDMEQLVAIVGEELCSTEKMFVARLGKNKNAVRTAKQFILTPTAIASLRANIDEITVKRVAAIKSAATLKVEFEQACKHANAEVRVAEAMYAQMMEGRDIVQEARAKAKAARCEADAFRQSMVDRIEGKRAKLPELEALLEPLRAQRKHAKEQGLDVALIEAKGNPIIKELKAVKASIAELVEQMDDEDSDYNVQLCKLVREAERLDADASQVLSGEALRELVAANTRTARLRELQQPVSVVNADLSDAPAVSSIRQTGGNGRSRVFVWKHGLQELSLEDRLDALEDTIVKARAARVASVPWLAHMLKQVQDLITEARGTNALCPVTHFGYKPLDVAGCMMQLKQKFGRYEETVALAPFEFEAADFASIKHDTKSSPVDVDAALLAAAVPKYALPSALPAVLTTGRISRKQARNAQAKDAQEEAEYELADQNVSMKFGKDSTHADNTAATKAKPKLTLLVATPEEQAEDWAWSWAQGNFWTEQEQTMTVREQREARLATMLAEQTVRAAVKEARLKEEQLAKKEADKATKAKLLQAKAEAKAAAAAAATVATKPVAADVAAEPIIVVAPAVVDTIADADAETWATAWGQAVFWSDNLANLTVKNMKEANLYATTAVQNAKIARDTAIAREVKQAKQMEADARKKLAQAQKAEKEAEEKKAAAARVTAAAARVAKEKAEAANSVEPVDTSVSADPSTKAGRAKMVSSALDNMRTVDANGRSYLVMRTSSATISMVEAFAGKTCEVKHKTVELKTVRIGPIPVLACDSISGRFMKSGIRCSVPEKDGEWFIEFDCQNTQSKKEQAERVSIVLDELIQHGVFTDSSDILSKFQTKLFVSTDDAKSDKSDRPSAKKARARKLAQ
jgi:hypothetical protein